MLKYTERMIENLEYLGLDFDNLPNSLKNAESINYRVVKSYDEKQFKQYRFIPVKDIQILLTKSNRLDSLEEKYKKSSPLIEYLDNKNEKNILKHTLFLKMIKEAKIEDIEKVEEEQKKLNKMLPFKVKFEGNYLWQVYYSENDDKYFMLVPIEDLDCSTFLYLLKRKIDNIPNDKIFVPISNTNYTNEYLNKKEFEEIENYIWNFTKDWPLIYEVYNKKDEMKIQIVGETNIYGKIKTNYKIVLKNKQEASEFYKLLKALFILQTEVPNFFKFNTRINRNASLEFFLEDQIIVFEKLADFIKKQYKIGIEKIEEANRKINKYKEMLKELKEISTMQEIEYLNKEKQITTFLECKKSFFGKFKYYFKYGKSNKKIKEDTIRNSNYKTQYNNNKEVLKEIKRKEKYTIDELIEEYKQLELLEIERKNLLMDLNALKLKNKNTKKKIENASNFIKDIDNHKRSIFEFWKYANKDELDVLPEGELEEEFNNNEIEKTFDYTEDFDKFGEQMDKIQRKILTKEETDSIFITTTNLLDVLNKLKFGNIQSKELERNLKILKEEAKKEKSLSESEEFDIFGSVIDDKTKVKKINDKKHRELPKDIYSILGITKKTKLLQYIAELEKITKNIYGAIVKISVPENIPIYKASMEDTLDANYINMFNINPENEIKDVIKKEGKRINFYKINLKKGEKGIAITNNIFYDNKNKTLPLGMDLSTKIVVDISKMNLKLAKKTMLKKLCFQDEKNDFIKPEIKSIVVFEYDVISDKEVESSSKRKNS